MTPTLERDLAWDLLDATGHRLSFAERMAAFVHLGAGDHSLAMQYTLEVLARQQVRLPTDISARLDEWAEVYDISRSVRELLARVIGSDEQ